MSDSLQIEFSLQKWGSLSKRTTEFLSKESFSPKRVSLQGEFLSKESFLLLLFPQQWPWEEDDRLTQGLFSVLKSISITFFRQLQKGSFSLRLCVWACEASRRKVNIGRSHWRRVFRSWHPLSYTLRHSLLLLLPDAAVATAYGAVKSCHIICFSVTFIFSY